MRAWLRSRDGRVRLPIGAGGLVLGRRPDCDVVSDDPRASRVHALVRHGVDGVELLGLGRRPPTHNERPIEGPTPLFDGDVVGIPGVALTVEIRGTSVLPPGWVLETADGRFGVPGFPFTIGGDPEDNLVVAWPPSAVRIEEGPRIVSDVVDVQGAETSFRMACDGVVVVLRLSREDRTTLAGDDHTPLGITLQFLPKGGLLTVRTAAGRCSLPLADRRCDLVATLLQPPGGVAGDWVDDETLAARIWGASAGRGRKDVNLLLHRVRRDLSNADLDGMRLLERSPAGGATRFATDGAPVSVE